MSAWAGEPDHFAKRFEAEGGDKRGFAERRMFGRYLGEILDGAVASGKTRTVDAAACSAARDKDAWRVMLDNGERIDADALALAVGNQEPEALSAFTGVGDRFIRNPWGPDSHAAVTELATTGGSALLVGTGLTMVDLVLSLDAAGHRGRIVGLSRRGLIPRSHADFDPAPVEFDELPDGSLRSLWRWLRKRGAEVGWRAAIDSLRPHSQALWQGLNGEQQRQFLRHARPWWDVHRHRIAPEVARKLHDMIAEGRLEIVAGRIVSARDKGDALEVDFRRRGAGQPQTASLRTHSTAPARCTQSREPGIRCCAACSMPGKSAPTISASGSTSTTDRARATGCGRSAP